MSRILVTGGCGFIGSNFVRYYLENNKHSQITNLDKLTYAASDNLKDFTNERYEFIKGDICDFDTVKKAMDGCDYVINFAAETHVDNSIKSSEEFIRSNILGTHVLLEAAKELKIKRFIQISTDEVYGDIIEGSFSENSKLNPRNPYSATKASADLLCLSYYNTYELPIIITRTCNNFGPYQNKEKLIPHFISKLKNDDKVPLYGNGKNVREWIYVEDNCKAISLVLEKGKIGEIYNIGSGIEKENIEIAKHLLEFFDKDISYIEFVTDRPGHDLRYSINFRKILDLGFIPEDNFEDRLYQTFNWYKKRN